MKRLKLVRAWACYWFVWLVGGAFDFLPRRHRPARFINALCGPFFGYACYWALRSNPREGWRLKNLERGESPNEKGGQS